MLRCSKRVIFLFIEVGLILLALEHKGDIFIFYVPHEVLVQLFRANHRVLVRFLLYSFLVTHLPVCRRIDVRLGLLEVLLV